MTECVVCGKQWGGSTQVSTCSDDCRLGFAEVFRQFAVSGEERTEYLTVFYFKIRRLEDRVRKLEGRP